MHHVQSRTDFFQREVAPRAKRTLLSTIRLVIIAIVVALAVVLLGRSAGAYLVLDSPGRGDAIVVLGGDRNDCRYYRAIQVLNDENSRLLFVDSNTDEVQFGRTLAAQEEEFIRRSAGRLLDHVRVCPIQGDSTDGETKYVQRCLEDRGLNSVVLVTSDFHTRRALSIFRRRLPQYRWSVTAARDQTRFGEKWWRNRDWAKTAVLEWLKLIWWQTIDRWREPENPTGAAARFADSGKYDAFLVPGLIKANNGNILEFYRQGTVHIGSRGYEMLRVSTNNGVSFSAYGGGTRVTNVFVTNNGSGYTSAPTITLSGNATAIEPSVRET